MGTGAEEKRVQPAAVAVFALAFAPLFVLLRERDRRLAAAAERRSARRFFASKARSAASAASRITSASSRNRDCRQSELVARVEAVGVLREFATTADTWPT